MDTRAARGNRDEHTSVISLHASGRVAVVITSASRRFCRASGATGALLVVDLRTGKARRVLSGHPSTQPEKDVVVKTDGQALRRPDGRGVEFAADSLALSADGRTLYWKALTGRTLYRITTNALQNPRLSEKDLEARVERVAETEPTDGLWIDERGRLYLSAIEQDAVKVRDGDRITTLVQDKRLRWPDTFSEGPDGTIYVTSSSRT